MAIYQEEITDLNQLMEVRNEEFQFCPQNKCKTDQLNVLKKNLVRTHWNGLTLYLLNNSFLVFELLLKRDEK